MQQDKEKRDLFQKIKSQIKEKKKKKKAEEEKLQKEKELKEAIDAKNKKREMNLQNRRKGNLF